MSYNPYTWGDTTPLVKSGHEEEYAKLLKKFPFNKIEKRTVDGQEMTFFPKTYAKTNGVAGAGRTILFAPEPLDSSYKLMTAFYDFRTGAEVSEGVCHARFIASQGSDGKPESKSTASSIWGSIAYTDIRTKARLRGEGWEPLNIWDYHYRGLLMIIEALAMGYTGADCQTAIGGVDGSMGVTHFGITNVWGGTDKGFWIYGIDTSNNTIDGTSISNENLHVVDRSGVRRDTGIETPGFGYPITFQIKDVSGQYDTNELLIAKTKGNSSSGGSCGDSQDLYSGAAFASSRSTSDTYLGPFFLGSITPSGPNSNRGFALRKAV